MNNINQWVPERIQALKAYHVLTTDGMVKLDAMENPYPLPPELREAWRTCIGSVDINRYPDAGCTALKRRIRQTFSVPDRTEILLGNGSDELIQILATLVGGPSRCLMAPTPSFSMYALISAVSGSRFVEVPLDANFHIDKKQFIDEIDTHKPACIFLAYPNNPTGNSFPRDFIDQVIEAAPGLVVVDEAYHSFSKKSYLANIPFHPNLLVMRTLSKSGLAGLRLGMLFGFPGWITQLEKVRLPYNINNLTQAGACFCLDNYRAFEEQIAEILTDRRELAAELSKRDHVQPFATDTNFILFRTDIPADDLHQSLRKQGVAIKNLHGSNPLLHNCLRVTVGTADENQRFLKALDRCLEQSLE